MTGAMRPRRRLPSGVYWMRRLLVVGGALVVVFAVGRLLGGWSAPSAGRQAQPAAAPVRSSVTTGAAGSPPPRPSAADSGTSPGPSKPPPAVPTGACPDGDVVVRPALELAFGGRDVPIPLLLTTKKSPACTWEVSDASVAVKVTDGSERLWTTQQCPDAIPRRSVVVRPDRPAKVAVVWSGRQSDEGCTRIPAWVEPGSYKVTAAALGGNPRSNRFTLMRPPESTTTVTPRSASSGTASSGTASPRAGGDPTP